MISHIFSNPVLMTVLAIAGIIVLFFIVKKFFKWALILIVIVLAAFFLYYSFTTPGDVKEKVKGAYEKTLTKGEDVLKQGKEKIVDEGKKLTKGMSDTAAEKSKNRAKKVQPAD